MRFLKIIFILFSSFNSFADINESYNFDVSHLNHTSSVTYLSTRGLPEVPAKSFIVFSGNRDIGELDILKSWKKIKNTREWLISNGQKCRCRDEIKTKKIKANYFNANHEISYLGDFRGKHLFKVTIPLVKINGDEQFLLETLDFKATNLDFFTSQELKIDERLLLFYLMNFYQPNHQYKNILKVSLVMFYSLQIKIL